ncbi:DUF2807 domain-containing protein [Segetibacter sp. 3557_3]|uniref:head GIN domain-containing protein n=1 Tax=Segetibacter sp. 3557_3 TaxID=2547429 RepID=UPI0010586ACD|nr:head GIN domain-containing protein [Segetibacter sp. 3557_3]TDH26478.1 DUF2807 domain-containing protein [Segetibacter sp. 3557_3]
MKGVYMMWILLLAITSAGAQQVIYDENAEVRSVSNFRSIEVSGTVMLYVSQGSTHAVAVSAGEAKYNEKIKTEVNNGVLKISVEGGVWNGFSWANRKLKAYVSLPSLEKLEVSGASVANIMEGFKAQALNVSVSGASEVKGRVELKTLKLDVSGASVIRLSGTTESAAIDASGAARVHGYELKAETVRVNASGASTVNITAIKAFTADASGGSSVRYEGNATTGSLNASAGASIKKR